MITLGVILGHSARKSELEIEPEMGSTNPHLHGSPFLNIGTTVACLKQVGNTPDIKDRLIISHNMGKNR